jgi:hypothetical protein
MKYFQFVMIFESGIPVKAILDGFPGFFRLFPGAFGELGLFLGMPQKTG